jgi:hypothetical protein
MMVVRSKWDEDIAGSEGRALVWRMALWDLAMPLDSRQARRVAAEQAG